MRNSITKISLFILIGILVHSCALEKKVPNGKKLLTKNEIVVNGKNEASEIVTSQLYQKPNTNILGYHLRLNLYNLANTKHDSIYKAKFTKHPEKYKRKSKWLSAKQVNRLGESFWYAGIHDFLEKSGEPPSIVDKKSTEKSSLRLKSYYFNNGYFKDGETSTSYNGKSREFYSYPLLKEESKVVGLNLHTPKEYGSWKNMKLDHILTRGLNLINPIYDWGFTKNNNYQPNEIGVPDHAMLLATISI